jgi:hypothetical protein
MLMIHITHNEQQGAHETDQEKDTEDLEDH